MTCHWMFPHTCLETRGAGEPDWTTEQAPIRRFDFEWGRARGVTIRRRMDRGPLVDGLGYSLTLVREHWSEPVDPGEVFDLDVEGMTGLVDMNDRVIYALVDKPFTCADEALCERLGDGIGADIDDYGWATFAFGAPIEGPLILLGVE